MAFSDEIVQQVWEKGRGTLDQESSIWRKDECGAWMRREHYGNEHSEYGWKIINVTPGGADDVENLRPYHKENSFDPNSGQARCRLTADREHIQAPAHIDTPRNKNV